MGAIYINGGYASLDSTLLFPIESFRAACLNFVEGFIYMQAEFYVGNGIDNLFHLT